ncbi:MAG: transcriptional regulator [Micromonosporaceae bacterium]|nr:transcriptional regulator [Micromonosporaceae bacterium]
MHPLTVPTEFWEREDVLRALKARDFKALFLLLRRWVGASQLRIAVTTGLTPARVGSIMRGDHAVEKFELIERIADGLGMPDRCRLVVGLAPRAGATQVAAGESAVLEPPKRIAAPVSGEVLPEMSEPVETPASILARVKGRSKSPVDDVLLDAIDLYIDDVVARYEQDGPRVLAPDVVDQRRWIEPLLTTWARPQLRHRLIVAAAQLSALLSYMAVNLGRFGTARAYAVEAFQLADYADDNDLRAWIRGTQSFTEYYAGDYRAAARYAADGRRYAGRGPQAVRLAVNGEARAYGRLGDRRAVEVAVGEAYDLLAGFAPEPGMSSCISFGLYSEARVAANAATAYLALGATDEVLRHADRCRDIVDQSASRWSKSLVRLDMADALVRAPAPRADIEQAMELAREAMRACDGHRIESIEQRTRGFLGSLQRWSRHRGVKDFVDEARAWLDRSDGV